MVTDSARVTILTLSNGVIADPLRPPLPQKWGFHIQYMRIAISLQRVIRSTSCLVLWFWGRVFRDGGSNGDIYGSNKSKMAAAAMLEKLQVAMHISATGRLIHFMSCLVLGWGFRGRRIERRYLRLEQIQDGGHLG